MQPRFSVIAGGSDVTGALAAVNVQITVVDAAGIENDRVDFVFDDLHGMVAAPETGVELEVHLGYGAALVYMGRFKVDSVEFSGWHQQISVAARAADQGETLKERRSKEYEDKTLDDIFQEIAGRNGLGASIDGEVGSFHYEYLAQQEESDQAFATRLGRKHGATVTIKNGLLIVRKRGQGGLGPLTVAPGLNLVKYRVDYSDRPKHKEVVASYFDREKAKRVEITEPADGQGPLLRLREPYPNEAEAREAAKGKATELKRAKATAVFEIEGDPRAAAEMDVAVAGVRANVDGLWVAEQVQHRWGPRAATTTITCKPKE